MEKIGKFMSPWHHESVFLKECFEVLFRRLLAMKAHDVSRRRGFARELVGHFPILFGFANPLGGSRFIKNLAFLDDLTQKPIIVLQARSICRGVRTIRSSENRRSNAILMRMD